MLLNPPFPGGQVGAKHLLNLLWKGPIKSFIFKNKNTKSPTNNTIISKLIITMISIHILLYQAEFLKTSFIIYLHSLQKHCIIVLSKNVLKDIHDAKQFLVVFTIKTQHFLFYFFFQNKSRAIPIS